MITCPHHIVSKEATLHDLDSEIDTYINSVHTDHVLCFEFVRIYILHIIIIFKSNTWINSLCLVFRLVIKQLHALHALLKR